MRVLRNIKNFPHEKPQNLSGVWVMCSVFPRPGHLDERDAVLEKFPGALREAALFVQPARVDLRFELYRLRAEDALRGQLGERLYDKLHCAYRSSPSAHAASCSRPVLRRKTLPSISFALGQLGASFLSVSPMPEPPEVAKRTTVLPEKS